MKDCFLLMCAFLAIWTQTFATQSESEPFDYSSEGVYHEDTYLKILEKTYKSAPIRPIPSDVGEPLILTKYIEEHRLKEGREAARVDAKALGTEIESYAGYFTVNKHYNSNLFMWYFPVMEDSVEEAPLIIWLQGGPGSSSLFGLFNLIGPFKVSENGSLGEMPYSWGKRHSLLFIDNPVGTGFSFTDDDRGYSTNQAAIGENLYNALQQFLTIFSELRKAPLSIVGESYAGKHIPSLAIQIHRNRENKRPINLYGLAIGNGFIDPKSLQRLSYVVREVGLVKDQVADKMRAYEVMVRRCIARKQLIKAKEYSDSSLSLLLDESDLDNTQLFNYLTEADENSKHKYVYFVDRDDIRRALHVGNTTFSQQGGIPYDKLIPDIMNSAKPWLEELIRHYRVLCYVGHLDLMVPYHASVYTYYSMRFPGARCFKNAKRSPWYQADKIVGWRRSVGNFTDMMIRGAGHMVPLDQPAVALALIYAFARGTNEWTENIASQSESEPLECSSDDVEALDHSNEEHEEAYLKILKKTYGDGHAKPRPPLARTTTSDVGEPSNLTKYVTALK